MRKALVRKFAIVYNRKYVDALRERKPGGVPTIHVLETSNM
jgi:hypothetical protein